MGVKEQNLRKLLSAADSRFAENGIQLHVVGSVPQGLIDDFQGRLRATTLHGFIDDLRPFLDHSRLALVPEVVGGGFKLKFLDYIFGRMPIATIKDASAGLPEIIRCSLIHADTMETLVDEVINKIDDLVLLNTMQQSAFEAASKIFHWSDRGHLLRAAIDACVYQRA